MQFEPIAYIRTPFPTKFGIPRQSGLTEVTGRVIFEPAYRKPEALRGSEGYSHIWLLWIFSEAIRDGWSPTVRPPRLGGNTRVGVFATRSPYRPNPIGLSCVRLLGMENGELIVSGADLMDGTPILDIKPYLPYTDAHPDAAYGFAKEVQADGLSVRFAPGVCVEEEQRQALLQLLAQDPRPHYVQDDSRIYGFPFAGYEVKFQVEGTVLTVLSVEEQNREE